MKNIVADLIRVRFGQLAINNKIMNGEFKVPIHLALGHEAIAVAIRHCFSSLDKLCLTHRNVHYNLAFSENHDDEIDELMLQSSGVSGGAMGSMNMTNVDKGLIYTSSILGNNLPVACGVAMAEKQKKGGVTCVVTGDGSLEEGAFYESLMLAQSLSLPLIFIVENNSWSMFTQVEQRRCAIDLSQFASSLGIEYVALRGNDVLLYVELLLQSFKGAVNKSKPILVEVELTTQGGWVLEDEGSSRFINYHHGAAGKIEPDSSGIIVHNDSDPLYVTSQKNPSLFEQTKTKFFE